MSVCGSLNFRVCAIGRCKLGAGVLHYRVHRSTGLDSKGEGAGAQSSPDHVSNDKVTSP